MNSVKVERFEAWKVEAEESRRRRRADGFSCRVIGVGKFGEVDIGL